MDRLNAMAILLAVVEAGSLSAASRRLGKPLATISRKVAELEAHLNTRLFSRSSRTITLTEAGRSYVAACGRILEDVKEAERAASGEYSAPTGELFITAPIVFGRLHLLPVALEFLRMHPDIDIRLMLVDRLVNLVEEHVDLAVRIGALPDSSLIAVRVGAIRMVVCGSPDYFARRERPHAPGDLAGHDCITFATLAQPDTWQFVDRRTGAKQAQVPVAVKSRLTVNTAEAAIDAALAGIGITRVLSYQIADAVESGALEIALAGHEPDPWPVNLLRAGDRLLPIKLRAFLDFAVPLLRTRLSQIEMLGA